MTKPEKHNRDPYLEPSPYSADGGNLIGRDPRAITDWPEYPGQRLVGLRAIRAKCLDCSHTASEVRKCTAVACPLWPLRMAAVPKGYRPETTVSPEITPTERRTAYLAENDG